MSVMYKDGSTWSNLMLQAYPVGTVYISYSSTPPASLFGGTWTPITGVFPYFNAGTATGGSNTHTLTADEIPSHRHQLWVTRTNLTQNSSGNSWVNVTQSSVTAISTSSTTNVGGSQPHNNMPAYQTLYAWRRTA